MNTRTSPPPGVPSLMFFSDTRSSVERDRKNVKGGSLGRHDEVSSSGFEAGRRRTIGVVAAL